MEQDSDLIPKSNKWKIQLSVILVLAVIVFFIVLLEVCMVYFHKSYVHHHLHQCATPAHHLSPLPGLPGVKKD